MSAADDEDLDTLTRADLSDLLTITGKVGASGEALDALAALRRKLKNAITLGLVAHLEPEDAAPALTPLERTSEGMDMTSEPEPVRMDELAPAGT